MSCPMRSLPMAIVAAAVAATCLSCEKERQSFVPNAGDGEITPTMATADVSTFISDSGYTRYHITTDLWQMFEDAPEPFWKFPDGLHLEQYDETMQPAANVRCDSAIYLSRKRLWQLDGHVVMVNVEQDSFLTQQLFWDQNTQKVYSDSFIHIVRTDRIIEGYGFESNQNMTAYTVLRPTGIIPVNRPATGTSTADTDTTKADSTPAANPRRRPRPVQSSPAPPPPASPDAMPFRKI